MDVKMLVAIVVVISFLMIPQISQDGSADEMEECDIQILFYDGLEDPYDNTAVTIKNLNTQDSVLRYTDSQGEVYFTADDFDSGLFDGDVLEWSVDTDNYYYWVLNEQFTSYSTYMYFDSNLLLGKSATNVLRLGTHELEITSTGGLKSTQRINRFTADSGCTAGLGGSYQLKATMTAKDSRVQITTSYYTHTISVNINQNSQSWSNSANPPTPAWSVGPNTNTLAGTGAVGAAQTAKAYLKIDDSTSGFMGSHEIKRSVWI